MKTVANSTKSAYPSYDQADFFDGTAARKIEHGARIISIDRRSVHTSGAIAQETSRRSERGAARAPLMSKALQRQRFATILHFRYALLVRSNSLTQAAKPSLTICWSRLRLLSRSLLPLVFLLFLPRFSLS